MWKQKFVKVIYFFMVVMLLEVTVFNYKYWISRNYHTITPTVTFSDGTVVEYGVPYSLDARLMLNIKSVDENVHNIHLGISDIYNKEQGESIKEKNIHDILRAGIEISDEGNSSLYSISETMVSSLYPLSQYISVEAFGKTQDIQMNISDKLGYYVVFDKITLNEPVCFRFVFFRVLILWMFLIAIYCFVFSTYEQCDYHQNKTRYKSAAVLVITMMIMVFLLSLTNHYLINVDPGYQVLARSLSEGRLWVGENWDSILGEMDNPYDYGKRTSMGASYYWDTAYYNGYYYIYFGITPVLIFFLPYYLITGQDLTYYQVEIIILLIITICGFVLVDLLRKRIAPDAPWKLTMLLSVIMATLSGSILFIKKVQIYYTAIGTALMLVMIGLCLWMLSMNKFHSNKKKMSMIYGMLGSFSMGLAVGARPQFAMASFLAFAIFAEYFKNIRLRWNRLILLLVPYVPVAAGLMWYNNVRFGSPLDFGANYNLTGYDMKHMGIHLSRIPVGVWHYLFHIPRFNIEFPYIIAETVKTDYAGYMASELQLGGVLALLPISWLIMVLLSKRYRNCLKQSNPTTYRNNMLMCTLCLISVLIIVIADTIMCGILMRYQMDYRIYLLLATIVIALMMIKYIGLDGKSKKYYIVIAVLGLLTILFGVFTVTAQYEWPDYSTIGYENSVYLWIKELFSF